MSQLTALPRPATRAARPSRPASRTTSSAAPRLRVVETKNAAEHTGVGFVVLCIVLLVGGLISLLLLNTNRAQESFAIEKLQARSASLTDQQQGLSSQLDAISAPQQLALRAQSMGLAPATKVRYVRKSDGRVLGVAKRSGQDSALTVDTLPSTPASRAAGVAVSTASSGLLVTKPLPAAVKAKSDAAAKSKTVQKSTAKDAKKATSKKPTSKSKNSSSKSGNQSTSGKSTNGDKSGGTAKPTAQSTPKSTQSAN